MEMAPDNRPRQHAVKITMTIIVLHNRYLVLELLSGGEFFSHLQSMGRLSEEVTRFYSAAVVLAFEELHAHLIAYRDLKPENMVHPLSD